VSQKATASPAGHGGRSPRLPKLLAPALRKVRRVGIHPAVSVAPLSRQARRTRLKAMAMPAAIVERAAVPVERVTKPRKVVVTSVSKP
jgi:hypothetical protein